MALTAERKCPMYGPEDKLHNLPMKAATKCWKGGIVVSDAGYAAPGRVAATLKVAGIAMETIDNTGAAGVKRIEIKSGCFKVKNSSAGDLIAQADVGKLCYLVDDETVAKTDASAARSPAGIIEAVDADGVFVWLGMEKN